MAVHQGLRKIEVFNAGDVGVAVQAGGEDVIEPGRFDISEVGVADQTAVGDHGDLADTEAGLEIGEDTRQGAGVVGVPGEDVMRDRDTLPGDEQTDHHLRAVAAMATVKQRAGIAVVRGHDLRRTFGAACEKLNFNDRQTKRMLGHGVAGGETLGRYTSPEWLDISHRMEDIEELILSKAPAVYNALRPKGVPRLPDAEDVVVQNKGTPRPSRRRPR